MTPEDRAARALLDTPYRSPKVRIAREIHDAVDEERQVFRDTIDRLTERVAQIEAAAEEPGPAIRAAISAIQVELQEARDRLRVRQ